jgi:hypothetical protein
MKHPAARMPTKRFFQFIVTSRCEATRESARRSGGAPESQTKPKFAILGISPADGTIAASVAPPGIRRFPSAAQTVVYILWDSISIDLDRKACGDEFLMQILSENGLACPLLKPKQT